VSMAMAIRLVLGLICGLVLTWLVWDRSERELADRAGREEHERPRFLPFSGSYYLPTLMLLYPILGAISGGAQKAVQLTLGLLLRVFLEAGIYYVLLLAMMPRLRRWVSARVCAMLWLLPDWLYVFAGRPDRPTDGKMLVLHAPGVLVYVLLAIWAVGAVGVMVWKIGSHLAFRRRILKNAVPVTDRQTLHVWEIELERAWIRKCKWKLVRSDAVTTPLSIGLYNRTTRIVLPMREYTQEELSLILRHEIIHISRGDPASKFFLTFCTAMCWFNPLMWAAMRKSADDFELSCDESVLLDEPQPVRRQYAELLLQTAGDERGFTTCLSATAGALRYRLKAVMKPEKKRTGAILIGLTLFALSMCSGYVALAYDAQPGAAHIFGGQDLSTVTVDSVDPWNDPRGKDGVCLNEEALKAYLASLELELYTEEIHAYNEDERTIFIEFDSPQGYLSAALCDRAVQVTRSQNGETTGRDYYLKTPLDWDYLDTLIAPVPNLQLIFLNNRVDRVVCRSLTRTAADGTVRVLLASEDWRYNEYLNEDVQEVQLGFSLPLSGPYTVTVEPLRGGARQTLTQDDLPGDCLPLTGPGAKYTVAAKLLGEDGAVYHAQYVFIFRKEAS
jgi:beta-lactamase regulating signal transducer with metallopeptidase domain